MPPLVYKSLGRDQVTIRPFKAYKDQRFTFTSGSAIPEGNVATAIRFATDELVDFDASTSPVNENGTFQEPLFETVEHTFYSSGSTGSFAFAAGGTGQRDFPLGDSVYIVNIAQRVWGEGIRRGTFNITCDGSGTIEDDGTGRLFVSSSGGSLNVVGNVFYNLGVAAINRLESAVGDELIQETGLFIDSGDLINVEFESTITLYEHQIVATIDPMEFNYSINPSARGAVSTGSLLDTGSAKVADVMASGTLSPYMTTIGLYNDRYQLVAVAKLPRPIKRLLNSQQSFIVRFDV